MQVSLWFVDDQERSRWSREDISRNQECIPFAVREFSGAVLGTTVLTSHQPIVSSDCDLDRDIGLLQEIIDDGNGSLNPSSLGVKCHVSCIKSLRHLTRSSVLGVDEVVDSHTGSSVSILITISRMRTTIFGVDISFNLDFMG